MIHRTGNYFLNDNQPKKPDYDAAAGPMCKAERDLEKEKQKKAREILNGENKENEVFNPHNLTDKQMSDIKYRSLDAYKDRSAFMGGIRYCRATFQETYISYDQRGAVALTKAEKRALKQNPQCFDERAYISRQIQESADAKQLDQETADGKIQRAASIEWNSKPASERWKQINLRLIPEDGKGTHIFHKTNLPGDPVFYLFYDGHKFSDPIAQQVSDFNAKSWFLINKNQDVCIIEDDRADRYNPSYKK